MKLTIAGALLASLTAITCAALLSTSAISTVVSDQNVLQTQAGAIRLGKVYKEILMTDYTVTNTEDGTVLLTASTRTPEIYNGAYATFKKQIDSVNRDGGAKGEDGKKTKLSYTDAAWTAPVSVKTTTYIRYEAEHAQDFRLTIDESNRDLAAGYGINKNLEDLKSYQENMMAAFTQTKHFIVQKKDEL